MKRFLLALVLQSLASAGCDVFTEVKRPTFRVTDFVDFKPRGVDLVKGDVKILVHNPNSRDMKILWLKAELFHKGNKIGEARRDEQVVIPGGSDYPYFITTRLEMSAVDRLKTALEAQDYSPVIARATTKVEIGSASSEESLEIEMPFDPNSVGFKKLAPLLKLQMPTPATTP